MLNTTKLCSIRLSVYNSVFNVNRRNNQFLHAGTVLDHDDDGETWAKPQALAEPLSSNSNTNFSSNNTSVLN